MSPEAEFVSPNPDATRRSMAATAAVSLALLVVGALVIGLSDTDHSIGWLLAQLLLPFLIGLLVTSVLSTRARGPWRWQRYLLTALVVTAIPFLLLVVPGLVGLY